MTMGEFTAIPQTVDSGHNACVTLFAPAGSPKVFEHGAVEDHLGAAQPGISAAGEAFIEGGCREPAAGSAASRPTHKHPHGCPLGRTDAPEAGRARSRDTIGR
jgi:hypothetical protein